MTTFSIGVLVSARQFLEFVRTGRVNENAFKRQFKGFDLSNSDQVLSVCQDCRWIRIDRDGAVCLTDAGIKIDAADNAVAALRLQIRDFILMVRPAWALLLRHGRGEAKKVLPEDVTECLENADLLSDDSEEGVQWWDQLSHVARGKLDDTNLELGRKGERLSREYEHSRTGRLPEWQSLVSDASGYDLLSRVSRRDGTSLRIEVKTSSGHRNTGGLYLSQNEAYVAKTSDRYVFHLWVMRPRAQLFVVDNKKVLQHVPANSGMGEWQVVWIPFAPLLGRMAPASVVQ